MKSNKVRGQLQIDFRKQMHLGLLEDTDANERTMLRDGFGDLRWGLDDLVQAIGLSLSRRIAGKTYNIFTWETR